MDCLSYFAFQISYNKEGRRQGRLFRSYVRMVNTASNPTILIVEDNPIEQRVLKELLLRFDYDSLVASSGEEALVVLGATRFAAVLMDLTLPGMDGFECTSKIRKIESEQGYRTPIIALTARSLQKDCDACLAAGMDAYMSKPFEPEELRKMLLRHVYLQERPNLKLLGLLDH